MKIVRVDPKRPENEGRATADARGAAPSELPARGQPWSYEELEPYVRGLVRRALGSEDERSDVVQDVFIRVVRRHTQLRDPQAIRAWVRSITFSVIANRLRERRRSIVTLDPAADAAGDLPAQLDARMVFARLGILMKRLTPQEQSAFELRYVEQRSFAEIAAREGYSLATARRRLARARRITLRSEKG